MVPTEQECIKLLEEHNPRIIAHSVFVKDICLKIADLVMSRGVEIDTDLLIAGALLHDLKKEYHHNDQHNITAAKFLEKLGYPEVGKIAEAHFFESPRETWEEKIVFLADKLCNPGQKLVSLQERFDYIGAKIPIEEKRLVNWMKEAQNVERELLDGKRLL